MTGDLLNYSSSPFRVLGANSRLPGYGAVATLNAEQFDRWFYRVVLVTTVLPADTVNPTVWDGNNQTTICWFLLGALADNNAILDATYLGDQNCAEYMIPILIPKRTNFYIRWPNVLAASAAKCNAIMTLQS